MRPKGCIPVLSKTGSPQGPASVLPYSYTVVFPLRNTLYTEHNLSICTCMNILPKICKYKKYRNTL